MSRERLAGVALGAVAVLAVALGAAALQVPPAPRGRVSDYAGLLGPAERGRVETRLAAVEAESSNVFAVAIFRSLEGESLEDFSIRLADAWEIGRADRDNGLILLVFTEDRRVRVEVGYGLEGAIPDALAGRVIRDVLAPRFRRGDYAGGILAAVDALDAASRGEYAPPARGRGRSPRGGAGLAPLGFLLFLFVAITAALRRASVLGGRRRRVWGGPWWWGGGLGGGFRGGGGLGGGGGFSGGGGGFGGGGASGGW